MTLTKKKMISKIGRRTRLKNRDVQVMLEALVEVWTDELVSGGRIELENLFVIETRQIERGPLAGMLRSKDGKYPAPSTIRRVTLRVSKTLKKRM